MDPARHLLAPACVVVLAVAASVGHAQLPGVPAAPAVPGGAPGAAAAATAADPGLGFFGRLCARLDVCKRNLVQTPFGQLLNNATKPLSAVTGGVVPTLEKKPTDKDAAAPGVGGAAAAGKKDAAEAAKRRDDVKYLGTLDCRYYPDASKALADALRMDPSECVRFEAALALSRSCCCNKTTVDALTASVSGADYDGNPAERSARVRMQACVALERCMACYIPPPDDEDEKPKVPKGEKKKGEDDKKTGTTSKSTMPPKEMMVKARETVDAFRDLVAVSQPVIQHQVQTTPKSLFHLVQAAAVEPQQRPLAVGTAYPIGVPTTAPTKPAVAAKPMPMPSPTSTFLGGSVARMDSVPAEPRKMPVAPKPVADTKPAVIEIPPPAVVETPPAVIETKPVAAPVVPAPTEPAAFTAVVAADPNEQLVKALSGRALQADAAVQHDAIRDLVRFDWTTYPLVASTCLVGAKATSFKDAVRVDFIRHAAAYKMAHPDMIEALTALNADPNPWVREEAAKAVEVLSAVK